MARGCEQFAVQTAAAIHDSSSAQDWVNEEESALAFMCGRAPQLSAGALEQIHGALDEKLKNLLDSGYFPSRPHIPDAVPRTLEGSITRVKAMIPLFTELEKNPRRDFGCLDARAKSGDRDAIAVKACFGSELRYVNADGKVETTVTMMVFRYEEDGSPEKYRFLEESSDVFKLPTVCGNGAPIYQARREGTSQNHSFAHTVAADCVRYRSEYSAIYPNLLIEY